MAFEHAAKRVAIPPILQLSEQQEVTAIGGVISYRLVPSGRTSCRPPGLRRNTQRPHLRGFDLRNRAAGPLRR